MMTKLAHIRENRKNNKGFSLVELIIVIAIMVALIAVMGPQYVKYVQSSRDAVVGDAAESTLSVVKSEYALNNLASTEKATIRIGAKDGNGVICVACDANVAVGANADSTTYDFYGALGIDEAKKVKSDVVYTITITPDTTTGGYTFKMEKTGDKVTGNSVPGVQPAAAAASGEQPAAAAESGEKST